MENKKTSIFEKATTDKEKSERLAKGSIISLLSTVFGGLFMTGWMISTTQLLGPEDFGIFGPVHQAFWAIATVVSLGINFAITTYVAHHYEDEPKEARKFAIEGNKLILIIATIFTMLSIIASLLLFYLGFIPLVYTAIILICTIAIFIDLQFWSLNGILLGIQRTDYYAINNFIFPTANFIFAFLGMIISQKILGKQSQIDIVAALSGLAFGGVAAYSSAMYFLKKVDMEIYRNLYNFKINYGIYAKIIKFGGITNIANISFTLFNSVAVVLVGYIAGHWGIFAQSKSLNLKISGWFSSSYLYASAAMMIMGLVWPLISAMSEAESQKKKELMQHYFDLILKYTIAILVGCFIFYASIGGQIVHLMAGQEYPIEKVGPMVVILSLGICFLGLFYLFMNIFIGVKKPQYSAISIGTGVIVQAIFITLSSFIFKDIYKVCIAFSLSSIITFGLTLFFMIYLVKLKIKIPIIIVPIICGTFAYFIANKLIPKDNLLFLICAVVLLAVYVIFFTLSDKLYLEKIASNKFDKNI